MPRSRMPPLGMPPPCFLACRRALTPSAMSHVAGTSHSSRCAGLWASMATSTSARRVPTSLVCRLHTTGVGRPAGHRFRPVRARAHRPRPPRTMHQPATSLPGPGSSDQAVLRSTAFKEPRSLFSPYYRTRLYVYVRCLLYTSPSPRDGLLSRMPSSA